MFSVLDFVLACYLTGEFFTIRLSGAFVFKVFSLEELKRGTR